jgi:hypothetical protein
MFALLAFLPILGTAADKGNIEGCFSGKKLFPFPISMYLGLNADGTALMILNPKSAKSTEFVVRYEQFPTNHDAVIRIVITRENEDLNAYLEKMEMSVDDMASVYDGSTKVTTTLYSKRYKRSMTVELVKTNECIQPTEWAN